MRFERIHHFTSASPKSPPHDPGVNTMPLHGSSSHTCWGYQMPLLLPMSWTAGWVGSLSGSATWQGNPELQFHVLYGRPPASVPVQVQLSRLVQFGSVQPILSVTKFTIFAVPAQLQSSITGTRKKCQFLPPLAVGLMQSWRAFNAASC